MKHYLDISRIKENDETELTENNTGCFEIGDHINISVKIDGANSSIKLGDDGKLIAFSRKNELTYSNTLRGFWNYVQLLDTSKFKDLGNRILFGEWLVSHTVKYYPESYNKWYVYDLYDLDTEQWLPQTEVKAFAESHGLEYIHVLYDGPFVSWEHCRTFLNSPAYGDQQEGVVIKNQSKLNNPDVRQPFYLKIVNDSFAETKICNHIKKELDPQHLEEQAKAEALTCQIVTLERVKKELNKMIDEGILPEKIQPQDMSIIAKNLPGRIYNDIVKEELEYVSQTIGNKYFGKAVNSAAMKYARDIVVG